MSNGQIVYMQRTTRRCADARTKREHKRARERSGDAAVEAGWAGLASSRWLGVCSRAGWRACRRCCDSVDIPFLTEEAVSVSAQSSSRAARRAFAVDGSLVMWIWCCWLCHPPFLFVNGVTTGIFFLDCEGQGGNNFFLPFLQAYCRQPTSARPHTIPRLRQGRCNSANQRPAPTWT